MATAAAAIVAKARRDVVSHFMAANAIAPDKALAWVPDRALHRRMLARFVRQGVLVETAPDTYYLDVPAYDEWRRRIRQRVGIAMAAVVTIGAIAALL